MFTVKFFQPASELLRKHIARFSFVKTEQSVNAEFVIYPDVVTILSLARQTALEIEKNCVTVNINPELEEVQTDVTGRFLTPLHFRYRGKFDEINIIFKPLGMAHFFPKPFAEIAPNNYQLYQPDFTDWDGFCENLFRQTTHNKQVKCLEEYFLQKYFQPDLENFSNAVDCFLNPQENRSIREISQSAGIHQKTMERLCQKHLGCSPATFRRIARFRHSIRLRLGEKEAKHLTDTSYQANFFDQSHFIKEYRKLSEMSPKEFFDSTWKMPEFDIVLKHL
jgi:AraC-like DNA-binding protein